MFIVEGADHLGKTTICKEVLKYTEDIYPTFFAHMTRPIENVFDFCGHYVDRMSVYGVQDRFHIGGLIYHEDKISQEVLKWIEGQLLIRGSFIVVVYTSDTEWYKKHLTENAKEEMFDVETILEVNEAYRTNGAIDQSFYSDMRIDIRDGQFVSYEMIMSMIKKWCDRLELQESFKRG